MKLPLLLILVFTLGMGVGQSFAQSFAQGDFTFGPREAAIEGSIPYTLIGKYKAQFRVFKGRIMLDGRTVKSVYLEIETNSIRSDHPWCDRIARSRRLLHASLYPKIIFKSDQIIKDEGGYKVKGILEMHGLKKRMIFPFTADIDQKTGSFDIKGSWMINRKDFNIIWNKYLDHGGVIVGDFFTVDWAIKTSQIERSSKSGILKI